MTHLLVVDDETQFRQALIKSLISQGYRATGIPDPDKLASEVAIQQPDVILLDLTFASGTNGLDACKQLRHWNSVPVIIISVSDDEPTKVNALSAGADDFMVKPFGILELLARVHAIQRRLVARPGLQNPVVQVRDLTINLQTRRVTLRGAPLDLTRKEYKLVEILANARGELVTYQMLLDNLWPHELLDADKRSAIRSLVKRLRQKLREDLGHPEYVLTQPGMGFRLDV
ncbi:MAG TPA: response regulator transcription factor [Aggregatilineales bacterium]|nr:response regulator transcription factor [Aggregatilineales bacterium]